MQPDAAGWQGAGGTPGHYGQDFNFNPRTGESGYSQNNTYLGSYGGAGSGFLSGIDPATGNQYYNLEGISDMFGGGGGGGYQNYQMTDFGGAGVTAPGAYGGGNWDDPNALSAQEVIESYRPTMEAEIGEGFAEAGNRLGQSGFAMSGAYAKGLGDVERLARAQMNQRTLEFGYDAEKFDRTQAQERQMAQNQEMYGGWQTQGGWDLQSQMANAGSAMEQWQAQNQYGFLDNQGQNLYNQQQQQQQDTFMSQIMAGIL
jgi:hypothetical protein